MPRRNRTKGRRRKPDPLPVAERHPSPSTSRLPVGVQACEVDISFLDRLSLVELRDYAVEWGVKVDVPDVELRDAVRRLVVAQTELGEGFESGNGSSVIFNDDQEHPVPPTTESLLVLRGPVILSAPVTSAPVLLSTATSTTMSAGFGTGIPSTGLPLRISPVEENPSTSASIRPLPPDMLKTLSVWRIKYSGVGDQPCPEAFLTSVEEFADTHGFERDRMLRALPLVLDGKAKSWFRLVREEIPTWKEFKTEIRLRFGPPDFQNRLEDEARARTQGPGESIADYLQGIRMLFSHFAREWTLEDQLKLAVKNLHPYYHERIATRNVTDYRWLTALGREVEYNRVIEEKYSPPPSSKDSVLPEAACDRESGSSPCSFEGELDAADEAESVVGSDSSLVCEEVKELVEVDNVEPDVVSDSSSTSDEERSTATSSDSSD